MPNLNCGNCYKLFNKDGLLPSCKTSEGCPIGEDLAGDIEVNEYLNQFIRCKTLYELNQVSAILESGYQSLEILNYPDELLELEQIYIKIKNKNQEKQSKWKKIL